MNKENDITQMCRSAHAFSLCENKTIQKNGYDGKKYSVMLLVNVDSNPQKSHTEIVVTTHPIETWMSYNGDYPGSEYSKLTPGCWVCVIQVFNFATLKEALVFFSLCITSRGKKSRISRCILLFNHFRKTHKLKLQHARLTQADASNIMKQRRQDAIEREKRIAAAVNVHTITEIFDRLPQFNYTTTFYEPLPCHVLLNASPLMLVKKRKKYIERDDTEDK